MAFRNWTIIGLFLISYVSLFAGAQEEIFLQANEAYKNQDFATAEQLYASIAKKGLAVWYNMGLTAEALNKPVYALAYFNRALEQAGPAQFWLIKEQINAIHPDNTFVGLFKNYMQYASSFLSLMHWQLLFLIMLLFCILFMKKNPRYLFYILFGFMLFVLAITIERYHLVSENKFFVGSPVTNVYTGPGKNFSIAGTIPIYGQGTVLQEKDSWYRVQYNKLKGWLEANDIVTG